DDLAPRAHGDGDRRVDFHQFLGGNEATEVFDLGAVDVCLSDPTLGVVAVAGDVDRVAGQRHAIEIAFADNALGRFEFKTELGLIRGDGFLPLGGNGVHG